LGFPADKSHFEETFGTSGGHLGFSVDNWTFSGGPSEFQMSIQDLEDHRCFRNSGGQWGFRVYTRNSGGQLGFQGTPQEFRRTVGVSGCIPGIQEDNWGPRISIRYFRRALGTQTGQVLSVALRSGLLV
jgi:hypothetical protein